MLDICENCNKSHGRFGCPIPNVSERSPAVVSIICYHLMHVSIWVSSNINPANKCARFEGFEDGGNAGIATSLWGWGHPYYVYILIFANILKVGFINILRLAFQTLILNLWRPKVNSNIYGNSTLATFLLILRALQGKTFSPETESSDCCHISYYLLVIKCFFKSFTTINWNKTRTNFSNNNIFFFIWMNILTLKFKNNFGYQGSSKPHPVSLILGHFFLAIGTLFHHKLGQGLE